MPMCVETIIISLVAGLWTLRSKGKYDQTWGIIYTWNKKSFTVVSFLCVYVDCVCQTAKVPLFCISIPVKTSCSFWGWHKLLLLQILIIWNEMPFILAKGPRWCQGLGSSVLQEELLWIWIIEYLNCLPFMV